MSERSMQPLDLDAELRALAAAIYWPPTPDVAARVRSRLVDAPVAGRGWRPALRLTRPLVLAVVLLLLAVAIAGAIVLGLPGLRITFTSDPLPSPNVPAATSAAPPSMPPGSSLGLGRLSTPADAAEALERPLRLPAGVDQPDAVYLDRVRGTPVVTLVWRASPELSALRAGSDVGLLISQFPATLDAALMDKLLREGETRVEVLGVAGHPAFWITGAEHILWFRRSDGDVVETFVRLVGDTLAVEVDGTIVRIETSGGREAAIEIAESML
jgi:hypothetical protein